MTVATIILLLIFAVAATLCLGAALGNWDWFFTSPGSLLRTLPRGAARLLASLIGLAILTMLAVICHDTFPSLF